MPFRSLKARVPFFVVVPLLVGIGISWWVSHFHMSRSWGAMEQEAARLMGTEIIRSIESETDHLRETARTISPAPDPTEQTRDWAFLLATNPNLHSISISSTAGSVHGVERMESGLQAFSGTVGQPLCLLREPSRPIDESPDSLSTDCSLNRPDGAPQRGYVGTRFTAPQFFMDFPLSNSWPPEFANGLLTIGMRQTDLQAALSNASVSQTMGGIALGGDDQLIALVAPSDRSIVFGVESARSEVAQLLSTSLLHGTNSTFQAVFQGTNVHVNITAPRWQDRGAGWRVLVLSPKPSVFSLDNQATRQTFFLALTALLLSVWLGLRIARSITGPAATLAGYAQSLQTGDHQPEKIGALRHREDEFGSLANSFLDMTEILLARQEDLKSLVEQRTTDLREQSESLAQKNEEAERLLLNILPPSIMRRLQSGEVRVVDEASNVTIIFCDLVGFTKMSEELPADQLVDILNTLFSEFDRLTLVHGVEKIKTIGDAYMAVAGLPESRPDHAHAAMEFALAMQDVLGALNRSLESTLAIRIGMNSGPVTAGIIGTHKFAYDIWGAAVNTASRMESAGIPGRIQVSGATYEQISAYYRFDDRGEIEIKGKGKMKAYLYLERLGVKPTPGSALASTSEPEPETSWGNILQADVSLGSIKALLSKDLFAKDSTSAKPRRKPGEDEDLDPPGNQPV